MLIFLEINKLFPSYSLVCLPIKLIQICEKKIKETLEYDPINLVKLLRHKYWIDQLQKGPRVPNQQSS